MKLTPRPPPGLPSGSGSDPELRVSAQNSNRSIRSESAGALGDGESIDEQDSLLRRESVGSADNFSLDDSALLSRLEADTAALTAAESSGDNSTVLAILARNAIAARKDQIETRRMV